MPKRTSTSTLPRRPSDVNQLAFLLVKETTKDHQPEPKPLVSRSVSKVMAQMGSRGGKIGGKRRLVTMTPEQRTQIASDAARARWAKKRDTQV
jgi:hypothetical protein